MECPQFNDRSWKLLVRSSAPNRSFSSDQMHVRAREFDTNGGRNNRADGEEGVILHIWARKISKTSIRSDDYEVFQFAYLALSERPARLLKPWQDANANLAAAYDRAQQV